MKGPTNVLSASSRPRTRLALVNSNGVVHSSGSSAEWTGRKLVKASVARMARV